MKEVQSLLFNKNAKVLQYGTKSYLLSPISLSYTENKNVSHFGKIQYWIQNDSLTQVCLQAFCTSGHPTVILKLHKGDEKARKGLYFSLSSNCFETNSLTSYQQCGSICFIQKQPGEEMFTSIKTSEVRQKFPIVTAPRLRKPHVPLVMAIPACLPGYQRRRLPTQDSLWEGMRVNWQNFGSRGRRLENPSEGRARLSVPRHEDGHSLFLFFNTLPFVEEVACRRVRQSELFLGL